ncbi:MAG: T9SS type A sorting domain-containing protein, partial [Marinirhabdus sp.]|nr:T9SS type A sorting domain-containing protein [Marinirhabdus sp.]
GLLLSNNIALTTLDGLESLSSIDSFFGMNGHPILTSIDALSNISPLSSITNFSIFDNAQLSECDITSICDRINDPSVGFVIENNNNGCNSREQIQIECGTVSIPDTNFLNALLDHNPIIDTNSDNLIQFDEAEAFTGTLNVANEIIIDFSGLEAFVNITGFNGGGNFADVLSLENNTALTSVDFSDSPDLSGVNLRNGNNTAITTFDGRMCPSLQFVCVDDVAFAEDNFTNIDAQVQFVDDCEFLGTPEASFEETLVLYPNPVSEKLTISNIEKFKFVKAAVFSMGGQKLKETTATEIDVSDLSAGIYFVKVISEAGSVTKKIVKQ